MPQKNFARLRSNCPCPGKIVGSVIEWLERRAYNQHGLGSKPTRAILLRSWERHFMAFSPYLVVLASSSKL